MPAYEWTKMAIASAVAIVAMLYLAIDAGVVNSSAITKRIETARASIAGTAVSQYQLAFAVQAWSGRGHQKPALKPALEECLVTD
ncbi:hypothetical protein [Bradyrhizobium sp. 21]|uniref:hypothetical protein n=1 Tax=Bradyrhizobium sp. 21 TaxID=2782666 RepID=UPI001FF8503D|nr:hypothetical protein [Bradyrhizobium sp. 21]MCK1388125.1 hypothetical protein [Bradyrhizobium sp. 21]